MLTFCDKCGKNYRDRHSCKAGRCDQCNRDFKRIKDHKCPLLGVADISPNELWENIRHKATRCDGCHELHFTTNTGRGLREYKGVYLCLDCYNIAEIEQNSLAMLTALTKLDQTMGKTTCSICQKLLIDPQTGCEVVGIKRVRTDVFSNDSSVWALVANGSSWNQVMAANLASHNMCVRCHCATSTAKHAIGIQRLKPLNLSTEMKCSIAAKVQNLTWMLAFQGFETGTREHVQSE